MKINRKYTDIRGNMPMPMPMFTSRPMTHDDVMPRFMMLQPSDDGAVTNDNFSVTIDNGSISVRTDQASDALL